jgi:hypothetical protein
LSEEEGDRLRSSCDDRLIDRTNMNWSIRSKPGLSAEFLWQCNFVLRTIVFLEKFAKAFVSGRRTFSEQAHVVIRVRFPGRYSSPVKSNVVMTVRFPARQSSKGMDQTERGITAESQQQKKFVIDQISEEGFCR